MKSLVLERMKKKGVADPDMKIADVDLDRDYLSETRFVVTVLPRYPVKIISCTPSVTTGGNLN